MAKTDIEKNVATKVVVEIEKRKTSQRSQISGKDVAVAQQVVPALFEIDRDIAQIGELALLRGRDGDGPLAADPAQLPHHPLEREPPAGEGDLPRFDEDPGIHPRNDEFPHDIGAHGDDHHHQDQFDKRITAVSFIN